MKYILMIWVCSFLNGPNCALPLTSTITYDSWYECSQAAYAKSRQMTAKFGYAYVNEYRIATKFTCKVAESPI
jgi:hypothetical protein